MEDDLRTVLAGGCGRGFTVLCTVMDSDLLSLVARVAGATGMVIAAAREPAAGADWAAVRCDPARAVPLRSHIVDAAVLKETEDLADVAEEVRRVLVPGGDVRVLASDAGDVAEAALLAAMIRPLRRDPSGVVVAQGP